MTPEMWSQEDVDIITDPAYQQALLHGAEAIIAYYLTRWEPEERVMRRLQQAAIESSHEFRVALERNMQVTDELYQLLHFGENLEIARTFVRAWDERTIIRTNSRHITDRAIPRRSDSDCSPAIATSSKGTKNIDRTEAVLAVPRMARRFGVGV